MAGGPAGFNQDFSCPDLLEKTNIRSALLSHTRLSRRIASHSNYSASHANFLPYSLVIANSSQVRYFYPRVKFSHLVVCKLTTPIQVFVYQLIYIAIETCKVWALTVSLATTPAIIIYFLFLNLLRCFSSVGSLTITLCIQVTVTRHVSSWVSPFGYPRIKACRQLPEAFRSLPRPSSVIYV